MPKMASSSPSGKGGSRGVPSTSWRPGTGIALVAARAAPRRGWASASSSSRTAPMPPPPIPSSFSIEDSAGVTRDPARRILASPVPLISPATIEAVREGSDLVELVRGRVELVRRGGRWWGRCPFHDERTPSFSLLPPDFRRYYCHGCGATGDAIDWMREQEGSATFDEAVERLAERFGIPVRFEEESPARRGPPRGGRAPAGAARARRGLLLRVPLARRRGRRRRASTSPAAASARSWCGASASATRPAAAPCWPGGRSARASRARRSSTPASPACAAARPPTSSPRGSRSRSPTARDGCRASARAPSTPASARST